MKLKVVDERLDPGLKEAIDEQQRLWEEELAQREQDSASLFETKARLHMIISGQVQSVSFRALVEHKAAQHNVTGWVRNNDDGTVEVVAEGERKDLQAFESACRKGPAAAKVKDVRVYWTKFQGAFDSFSRKS